MKKRPITVDELFTGLSPSIENAGAEALQSKLIDAFESAVLQGMYPLDALSVILEWVSSELNRVRTPNPSSGKSVQLNR
jgi:hypothetical protein